MILLRFTGGGFAFRMLHQQFLNQWSRPIVTQFKNMQVSLIEKPVEVALFFSNFTPLFRL
jgi:hypothetical protein